jgi:deoxyribodipyrimidine photo-lyase
MKRDLRWEDHTPLKTAIASRLPVIIFYIIEPKIYQNPNYSDRHWQFVLQSIVEMNENPPIENVKVHLWHEEVPVILQKISTLFDIKTLFSYQ